MTVFRKVLAEAYPWTNLWNILEKANRTTAFYIYVKMGLEHKRANQDNVQREKRISKLQNAIFECQNRNSDCSAPSVKEMATVLSELMLCCSSLDDLRFLYIVQHDYLHKDLSGIKERLNVTINNLEDMLWSAIDFVQDQRE